VNRPKLLLLDEPLGALDLKLRKQMQLELKRIQRDVGITFLYVTHDQEEAMTMSNRLAVMRFGKIEQIDAPAEVYEHPATEVRRGLPRRLQPARRRGPGSNRTPGLDPGAGSMIRVPTDKLDGMDGVVKAGVRPEKVRLEVGGQAEAPDGWNCVSGTLRETTFVGVSHQFTVDGPGNRTLTVYAQNLGAEEIPNLGAPVRLLWRPEHTFVVQPSEPLQEWEEEL
jgi:spermidine/putrescine transport system ATP-binding protein